MFDPKTSTLCYQVYWGYHTLRPIWQIAGPTSGVDFPKSLGPLHLLQQNLDDALLLCAVSRELVSLAGELVELCVRLEAQNLEVWVTTMIHQVEEVDEDGLQNLMHVSKVHRGS